MHRRNGDGYSVNNDTQDHLVIFSNEQVGNVAPSREMHTPHGTFGITVDEAAQEVFLTVQHDIALDAQRGLMFVTNHGSTHDSSVNSADYLSAAEKAERAKLVNWPLD